MKSLANRARLLGGVAMGVGVATLAPQQAIAQCVVAAPTLTCANTTTVDTQFPTNSGTGTDRAYIDDNTETTTVGAGVTIDGFGLSIADSTGGAFTVTNDGTIQVNVGNAPSALFGGSGALQMATNGDAMVYSGAGDILNLGTGEGFYARMFSGGSLNANFGGSVQADNGDAVRVFSDSANTGTIGIITTVGETIRASAGDGIEVDTAGSGNVGIISAAAISSGAAGVNTLQDGINVTSTGTGGITINNSGAIGTAGDRAQLTGISETVTNAASAGTLSVAGTGAIFAVGNGIDVSTAGSGNVSVVYGGALDTTAGTGVEANSTSGFLAVTTGGTINATNGDGINATSTTGTQAITANGAINAGGVGIRSLSTDGNQTIATTAAVTSAGTGIDAEATGTGSITINRTGAGVLTSNGGDGIEVDTTSGAINVTTGAITAAGNGIDGTSATGAISVNVTGNVTGGADAINLGSTGGTIAVNVTGGNVSATALGGDAIQVGSDAAKTITIAAGRAVTTTGTNGFAIYDAGGAGALLVNNSGTISAALDGRAIVSNSAATINNLAGATLTGTVTLSTGNDVINNTGIYNVSGANDFFAGTDAINNLAGGVLNVAAGSSIAGLETLSNAGTANITSGVIFDLGNTALVNNGTLNAAGTIDFGTGVDVLDNNLTGIINITGATSLTGLDTFNQSGRINLNANTLTLSGGAFGNAGTIDTSGSASILGITSFDNAGILDLAAGTFTVAAVPFINSGTIFADEGTTNITGQTSFSNTGTIDLSDGLTNDQLTIFSDFAGSGSSTLMLDVDDDISDQLIITGAASGSTTIDANLIGTGTLVPGGVLLVTTGSATADAFVLGDVSGNTSPLLDYSLEQSDDQFFLTTQVNELGFAPLPLTLIAGEMWYQSAEAVWAQAKLPSDGTNRMGIWGQIYASHDEAGEIDRQSINGNDVDADNRIESDRVGFQAGYGFPLGGMGSVGVTAGFGRADIDGDATGYETKGFNIGAYGTFGGATGIHGSLLAKHDQFDIEIDNSLFEEATPDGRSNGVDGEVGYRFGGTSGPAFGVSAGLSHVRTKLDDFSIAGLNYDFDSMTSTRGRVGVRATGNGPVSPFVDVRAYHEFSGDGDVRLSDGVDAYRLNAEGRGTWARIEAGIGGPASGLAPMVSAWVDLGDVKGFGGRGSFRF